MFGVQGSGFGVRGSILLRLGCWTFVILSHLLTSVQADTLEHKVARRVVRDYRRNEARLEQIDRELETLPSPYLREPTGTGGFISREGKGASFEATLTFIWDKPIEIDAVALFPLRLFMDEIYAENLYWPGTITIEAMIDNNAKIVAHRADGQPLLPQSLPELFSFSPVLTDSLTIRCSDLPQHPYEKWHAAGFAEICIFSGTANIAPRARLRHNGSRQGYHVLADEFLTDAQTPLGLPELSSRSRIHEFVKKIEKRGSKISLPYRLTCTYTDEITIDAVRLDPAIQHSYGQAFPVRFTIDLLDAKGRVLQSDQTYKDFPLRNPGLNPHFAYFPETTAKSVRLVVLEASQPVPKANQSIAFSEISPLYRGLVHHGPAIIEEGFRGTKISLETGVPLDTKAKQALASACDGLTHSGRLIPLREWIEGLTRRQALTEEQFILQDIQQSSIALVRNYIMLGSLSLLVLTIGGSLFFVVRHRIRTRRQLKAARVKIASDLHDDVGSNLGTIVLHVEKLQEQIDTPPEQKRLKAIYRLTRESVFGLREVLNSTAPEVGRLQNIVTYMEELAGLVLGKTDYSFECAPTISEALKEHKLRKGVLMFYKEALYNAKRHADCSHVDILIQIKDSTITIKIKDNGKGIDQEYLKKPRILRTLKQRANWLNANLDIKTAPGEGVDLTLSIPL